MKLYHLFSFFLIALSTVSCKKENSVIIEKSYNNIVCNKVIQTSDNNYMLVGSSFSQENARDFLILKFDKNYDKVWEYKLSKAFNQFGESVFETDDGFYCCWSKFKG